MEFVALDVETANADRSSICQVGMAHFLNGELQEEWKSYVNPEDYFDAMNISIHGIDEARVKEAPTLPEIANQIFGYLDNRVAVCHTTFDRVAMLQATRKYDLRSPLCTWLDSARVARRAWVQFASRGYGLDSVCSFLGYEFAHHDALEDAKAAGHILLSAVEFTGMDIQGWLQRVEEPCGDITRRGNTGPCAIEINPQGACYGETMVFTGTLEIPRRQATEMANRIGCVVEDGVTKRTTILVVGDRDARQLVAYEKSSKHRKAETLMQKGQGIRILLESDFAELVSCLG